MGEGVTHLKPGDRVFTYGSHGGLAEERISDARATIPIPDGMDFVTGASTLYAYGTSYHALKDRGQLKAGETLLVLGAAGGVGLAAVELGKLLGATVIAAASTEEKLAVCQQKGATHASTTRRKTCANKSRKLRAAKALMWCLTPWATDGPNPPSGRWPGGAVPGSGLCRGRYSEDTAEPGPAEGLCSYGCFLGMFTQKEAPLSQRNMQEIATWVMQGKLSPHIYRNIRWPTPRRRSPT